MNYSPVLFVFWVLGRELNIYAFHSSVIYAKSLIGLPWRFVRYHSFSAENLVHHFILFFLILLFTKVLEGRSSYYSSCYFNFYCHWLSVKDWLVFYHNVMGQENSQKMSGETTVLFRIFDFYCWYICYSFTHCKQWWNFLVDAIYVQLNKQVYEQTNKQSILLELD